MLSGVELGLIEVVSRDRLRSWFENASGPETGPIKDAVEAISTVSLPIGWSEFPKREQWLTMPLAWLITAFAVSLGAPFWFDLLNKFVNVRASGKAPEEEPKSPKEVPVPKEPGG
jgi:hypothetical protein